MSTVYVAVPALRAKLRLSIDKGRSWSVVEHLLLETLSKTNQTVSELERSADIPRRVVIEGIIRLMRAGWVQVTPARGSITFSATDLGRDVAGADDLPNASTRISRTVGFIVETISGSVFRSREIFLHRQGDVPTQVGQAPLVWMRSSVPHNYTLDDVTNLLLEDDEKFVEAESFGDRPFSGFAVVRVRDSKIVDGLPERDPTDLHVAILEAAASVSNPKAEESTTFEASPTSRISTRKPLKFEDINFSLDDLVLDGPAHKQTLEGIISSAVSRVFIHSTFLNEARILELLPLFTAAVQRGVRVDILWGQNEDRDQKASSREVVSRLQNTPEFVQYKDSLTVHPFSTNSHAKFIVADSGQGGDYVAVVGSCNWLCSSFNSYEASVVLRDPRIVADVVKCLADISHAKFGIWSKVTSELARLASELESKPVCFTGTGQASVVVGDQHNGVVLQARDESTNRIYVMSHRLGPSSLPAVIAPLTAAVGENSVQADVYFGRTTGHVRGSQKKKVLSRAESDGVAVKKINIPRLHAKVLGWDDDSVLITSLNWLSADPVSTHEAKEVGILLKVPGAARTVANDFQKARKL